MPHILEFDRVKKEAKLPTLIKHRILNKYNFFVLIIILVSLFATWFITVIYQYTFGFDIHAEDLGGNGREIQKSLLKQVLNLPMYMGSSMNASSFLLPILVPVLSVPFIREKKGLFIYRFLRNQQQSKVIVKTILSYALCTGAVFYLAYLLFLITGAIFNTQESTVDNTIFNTFFGVHFYSNHMILYYLLEGFITFFIFSFVYSLFACSIALITHKTHYSIIIPIVYYFFFSILFVLGFNLQLLAPTYTIGFSAFHGFPFYYIFTPLITPLIISVVITAYALTKHERIIA